MLNDDQKLRVQTLIDALRSNEYNQATGALHPSDGFCCLGVGCDVSGLGRWLPEGDGIMYYEPAGHDHKSSVFLPLLVGTYYGTEFDVRTPRGTATAANLNDEQGWTFEQIADLWQKALDEVDGHSFITRR